MKILPSPFRKAFTMLELVFVIVVVGILSYIVSSRFQRDTVMEAADQLASHLRYTQHLALTNDVFENNDSTYYRKRWHIRFANDSSGNNHLVYTITRDLNKNNTLEVNEPARNPLDPSKVLSGDSAMGTMRSEALDLSEKYKITLTNNCSNGRIFFDNMGRPYRDATFPATAPNQNLIQADCTLVLTNGTTTRTLRIARETGYITLF